MVKNVGTNGRNFSKGEIYFLSTSQAIEFMSLGWATPVNESTSLNPAARTATLKKVSKR